MSELKDSENASRAFKQALVLAPRDPLVLINNVLCLLSTGFRKEAIELFQLYKSLVDQNVAVSREVSLYIFSKCFTYFEQVLVLANQLEPLLVENEDKDLNESCKPKEIIGNESESIASEITEGSPRLEPDEV